MELDVIIIGSGPAGLTAGIYCARAGKRVKVFAGESIGGQLTMTSVVENYPGFEDGIAGGDLMANMMAQALGQGVEVEYEKVTFLEKLSNDKFFLVIDGNNNSYLAKAVIIATGTATRWLGVKGEQELIGKGVSACAVCDGSFYKDKTVGVVGGGDSACEEALYLSHIAKRVLMFVRKEHMRAQAILQEKVNNAENITVLYDKAVHEVIADENGNLKGVNFNEGEDTLMLDGLFVAIGRIVDLSFMGESVRRVYNERIEVDELGRTHIRGLFAAGDVTNTNRNQAIIAAGQGACAALGVIGYLS